MSRDTKIEFGLYFSVIHTGRVSTGNGSSLNKHQRFVMNGERKVSRRKSKPDVIVNMAGKLPKIATMDPLEAFRDRNKKKGKRRENHTKCVTKCSNLICSFN